MATPVESPAGWSHAVAQRPHSFVRHVAAISMRSAGRTIRLDRSALAGLCIVTLIVGAAIVAPLLTPFDPIQGVLADRLLPPVWFSKGTFAHLLGTDALGRDVFARALYGARTSLLIASGVVLITAAIGSALGVLAGYRGGRVDAYIMRWIDIQIAFPSLLLSLVILAVVPPNVATLIVVLALNGWMVYARMIRTMVMSLRQAPYVEAAHIIGCPPVRIVLRHMLPGVSGPLLTLGVIEFARVILSEAALSFLGLGIQPPTASWGVDIATGRNYLFSAWWLVAVPGMAMTITVLGFNMLAAGLRVATDSGEQNRRYAQLAESTALT